MIAVHAHPKMSVGCNQTRARLVDETPSIQGCISHGKCLHVDGASVLDLHPSAGSVLRLSLVAAYEYVPVAVNSTAHVCEAQE